MKTIKIDKTHWLIKIAIEWGKLDSYYDTDICNLTRRVIVGVLSLILAVTIMVALACVVIWMVGTTLAAWAFLLVYGKEALGIIINDPTPVVTTGILLIMAMSLLGTWFNRLYREYSSARVERDMRNNVPPHNNVIGRMYRSFKEKTCYKVELTSKEEANKSD